MTRLSPRILRLSPRVIVATLLAWSAVAPVVAPSSAAAVAPPSAASAAPPSAAPAAPPATTASADATTQVRGGTLYVFGHRMDPPYVLWLHDDTLFVNGLSIDPKPVVPVKPAAIPDSMRALLRRRGDLTARIRALDDSLLRARAAPAEIAVRVASLARSASALVDSVQEQWPLLTVWWRGARKPEDLTLHASKAELDWKPPPRRQALLNEMSSLASMLDQGVLAILSEAGGDLFIPADDTSEVVKEVRRAREGHFARLSVADVEQMSPEDRRDFGRQWQHLTPEIVQELADPPKLPVRKGGPAPSLAIPGLKEP